MSIRRPALVSVFLLASSVLPARTPGGPAAALQPFVDRHELAGAVTLVATKDKVLDVEAVGWADIGAKKPMSAKSFFDTNILVYCYTSTEPSKQAIAVEKAGMKLIELQRRSVKTLKSSRMISAPLKGLL